ncbi:MAG: CDP-alcohol phosphatidyltransferase family protein [Crocinitomicaceae bacterium]|nr:CDP-alcohol phosphatidyltransferase family protein [Crocinitomicaceae bacterium]
MSGFKRLIPHLFTAGNLIGGVLAIIFALTGRLEWAPYCIFISAFLDFFDGFAARLLKVPSEMGKQLDSLADMVTFGVAPGVIVLMLVKLSILSKWAMPRLGYHDWQYDYFVLTDFTVLDRIFQSEIISPYSSIGNQTQFLFCWLPWFALLIPVMSMFRLAKFNLDTRQSDSFIGLPTPANTLFFASLPLILIQLSGSNSGWQMWVSNLILNPWFLIIAAVIMSIMLVAELPLFALKFKTFGWKGNEIRYIFLTLCAVMLATLWWLAIPLIIILYILLSLIQNLRTR